MVYNDRVYIGDNNGIPMEVITMAHELNIGTISGYSADELVNRITASIPSTVVQVQKDYITVTDAFQTEDQTIDRSLSIGYSANLINYQLVSDVKLLQYDYVSVVISINGSISGTLTSSTGVYQAYGSVSIGDHISSKEEEDEKKNAVLIHSETNTHQNVAISLLGNAHFYLRYTQEDGFQIKRKLDDSWLATTPWLYITVRSPNSCTGTLTVKGTYKCLSAYGVLR